MWAHSDKKTDDISLHDCRATQADTDNNNLYFDFAEGFWIISDTKNNPYSNTLRTDKARLKICNYEISDIYVFKDIRFFRRLLRTYRVSLSPEKLIENINNGKWELEFISEYHTCRGVLFTCCIWAERKPYHRECQLIIDCDGMECFWNKLREDCSW